MSYADYLQLDKLLTAQAPISSTHDEMLFIILHQASELWFKLMIHELRRAIEGIRADRAQVAFKTLSRVSRIQAQIIQSWDVLSTLTPADYLTFRDDLGHSSGFQSWQYRTVEFLLGMRGFTDSRAARPKCPTFQGNVASKPRPGPPRPNRKGPEEVILSVFFSRFP